MVFYKELIMANVNVNVATTWISVRTNSMGVLLDCDFRMSDYIRSMLYEREWNPKLKYMEITSKYLWYDKESMMLYMPRYSLQSFKEYIEAYGINVIENIVQPIKPQKVKMSMKPGFNLRDEQIEPAAFLADESVGFRPLALRPGFGKTCLSINTIVKLGYRAIVVLGMLIDQWKDAILQFTTMKESDIYIVKGVDSLKMLWKMIDNGKKPNIVLFSTRTLDLYAIDRAEGYRELRSYNELCKKLGIGVKIIDECHLKFGTNSQIDFRSNIKMNVYLSATYQRNSRDGRRIFDMYFPPEMKFGEQLIRKYTTVEFVYYHLCIPREHIFRFKTFKGYNHAMYEKYLFRHRKYFNAFVSDIIITMIIQYFFNVRKQGQHCLILCQSRLFSIELADKLCKELDDTETISVFFSGDKDYGNEERLKSDIVVSTVQSCGTGRDIKGLKTCINTVSMASAPQAIQCLGRLREIPGEDTYYIDMCNEEIMSQVNHARVRLDIFKQKAKAVETFKLR